MDTVHVVSFEIGRNRKPSSLERPNQPLTDSEWFRFKMALRVPMAVKARTIDGAWIQTFNGEHYWNEIAETRYKVELYYPGKRRSALVQELKEYAELLAFDWYQDAIGCCEGRASMILPLK